MKLLRYGPAGSEKPGMLDDQGRVDNDATLEIYAQAAVAQARAGAHVLAPSGMMDGQVAVIRAALDDAVFTDTGIIAYAAKYASAFYGPFREAVGSSLQGDRRTYQQDSANRTEALREVRLDLDEGADIAATALRATPASAAYAAWRSAAGR